MKANDIVRAFFMAVVLFMGIGSAQADVLKVLYDESKHGPMSTITIQEHNAFDNYHGDVLRVTYDINPQQGWQPSYAIKFTTNNKGIIATIPVTESGHYDQVLDDDFLNKANTTDKYNVCLNIVAEWITIHKVEIISAGSDSGGTKPTTYSVSISTDIVNGIVTANPTEAVEGETVVLTVMPNDGYELVRLSVKDAYDGDVPVMDNQFTMPASDVTVSAEFTEKIAPSIYYVSISSDIVNGVVTANPTEAVEGETVVLTVMPNDGYELVRLSVKDAYDGDVPVMDNQFTMPASDVTVSAEFTEKIASSTVTAIISSSTGYATFCSEQALDFSDVSGLTAYYAKSVSNGMVALEQVIGTVAEGTGLIIYGTTAEIPVAASGAKISGNLLVGVSDKDETIGGADKYVLTEENGEIKFASTAARSAIVPMGHAYLQVSSPSNYSRFSVSVRGEATNIEDATLFNNQEDNIYYDLRGVRVANPTHGIYIVNGKKVFVK